MKNYCTIRHTIQGRLRVSVQVARYKEEPLAYIQNQLLGLSSILLVRINPHCNALIVHYEAKQISVKTILTHINKYMATVLSFTQTRPAISNKKVSQTTKTEKKTCYACSTSQSSDSCVPCTNLKATQEDLIAPAFKRFASLSFIMGGVFIRKLLGLTITQTIFSPLGIAALIASIPLIKESYKQIKKKKVTLEGFLGGGCIVAVCAGEALTAFEILWINSGAELLTAWVTERSRKSIASILDLTSHHTFVLVEGVEIEKKVSELKEGDIVVLHTGEKVCIDGEIIDGHAMLDESSITGRADFVSRTVGDTVLAGTFVSQGLIYVAAHKVGDSTYLSRILCLVEDSLAHKAPIEALADKLAKKIILLGFVSTGLTYVLTASLWRAFTVLLVMACPCATVLAASTAVSASINTAARKNILIKGGRYIEEIGKIDCVCFDKTGTLTSSEPKLVDIILLKETKHYKELQEALINPLSSDAKIDENCDHKIAEEALLQIVLSTEMHNHHPLAQAIKQEALSRNIEPIPHASCEYVLGMGMKAVINAYEILVGNQKLMEEEQVFIDESNTNLLAQVFNLQNTGKTVLFVAINSQIIALLAFDNPIRPESKNVIKSLKEKGIENIYLLTGDEHNTAQNLSKELGIKEFYASVMPEQKAEIIQELQKKHKSVLMLGDGINDAMALAKADISVAMGIGGSEVAVEAASIILVNDDLQSLNYLYSLSKQTVRVVHQNFWLATGSNLVGLVLGAAGTLSPVMAGMIHIVHTLGVLANSSRLLKFEQKQIAQEK